MDLARVLVVDDDEAIRFFLAEELTLAGYTVLTAASGEEALAQLQQETVDLILLDLKMGGMDGLRVMEAVEKQPLAPVVIILTAHASLDTAIGALRRGAIDYLLKPCSTEELLSSVARGLAHREDNLRRQALVQLIAESAQQLRAPSRKATPGKAAEAPRFLEARGLLLDRERLAVTRQGKPLDLTPTEFKLLIYLMEHADRPCSFAEIARALHGSSEDESTARQSLSTHLWRLMHKLGEGPGGSAYIVNVRGRGYAFVARGMPPRNL